MIGWGDVYKVVAATAPLYVALGLGYAAVRRWRMFKPDHCDAINRFNCYFILPFFNFHFTASINPYQMNYRFLAGDVIAKVIVGVVLVLWANLCRRRGSFAWAITSFSLSSYNNTLVVGVPLLRAMYGVLGEDLVVQASVLQALVWFPVALFMFEYRRMVTDNGGDCELRQASQVVQLDSVHVEVVEDGHAADKNNDRTHADQNEIIMGVMKSLTMLWMSSSHLGSTVGKVFVKLGKNPNCFACVLGVVWSLLAKRWSLEMPSIVEGSVMIMAKAGSGVAMFSMGLFMGLQEKIIACGVRLTMYAMAMRFVVGPLAMSVGSLALGLRSNVLQIAIVQAALPQAIASFVYAQEYGLHADVLSTAVIFGTVASVPLLITYYVILDIVCH